MVGKKEKENGQKAKSTGVFGQENAEKIGRLATGKPSRSGTKVNIKVKVAEGMATPREGMEDGPSRKVGCINSEK